MWAFWSCRVVRGLWLTCSIGPGCHMNLSRLSQGQHVFLNIKVSLLVLILLNNFIYVISGSKENLPNRIFSEHT